MSHTPRHDESPAPAHSQRSSSNPSEPVTDPGGWCSSASRETTNPPNSGHTTVHTTPQHSLPRHAIMQEHQHHPTDAETHTPNLFTQNLDTISPSPHPHRSDDEQMADQSKGLFDTSSSSDDEGKARTAANPSPGVAHPDATPNLYVNNLAEHIRDSALGALFSPFGKVRYAKVMINMQEERSRGFGFVLMENAAAATNALRGLDRVSVGGHVLSVAFSHQSHDHLVADTDFIMIRHIPLGTSQDEVTALCEPFGRVANVAFTSQVQGYKNANVWFESKGDPARRAEAALHDRPNPWVLNGRRLYAKFGEPKTERLTRQIVNGNIHPRHLAQRGMHLPFEQQQPPPQYSHGLGFAAFHQQMATTPPTVMVMPQPPSPPPYQQRVFHQQQQANWQPQPPPPAYTPQRWFDGGWAPQ